MKRGETHLGVRNNRKGRERRDNNINKEGRGEESAD